jgi:DNA polymerase II small subunit
VSETTRLQKAIEATIAAGYQLDSEAFTYLASVAATEDPTELVNRALLKIEELDEKPFFIERPFLKQLHEAEQSQPQEPQSHPPPQENVCETDPQPTFRFEGANLFEPYAKDVEPQIKIIEDPTNKLSSNGTIEDYIQYFQDRFKRLEKLLRQRIDVKSATPILEALKSQPRTKLKIICMISEKREAKQHTILTVEDLQGTATVLITRNAPEELRKKAQTLLMDQVVCIAVQKTRSRLFLAEDIIFPEIGQKPMLRAAEPVFAVLTSDLHVGSNKFNKEAFKKFIQWLQGKYGDDRTREIASHVKYVLIAGDIVDGIGVYPNQIKELVVRDVHRQYEYASSLLERIPEYIEVVVAPGNHDAPRKSLPQPAIAENLFKTLRENRKIHSLGDPAIVSVHGIEVLMYHGRSLDDIVGTIPGIDHNHPEKAMKLLLQSRHLAPFYGGKTQITPESRDFLAIERPPDIFHAGHIHVLGYCNHKGVLIVNSGGWQEQTDYMAKLGLMPTPGKVPVVNLQTMETTVLSFA